MMFHFYTLPIDQNFFHVIKTEEMIDTKSDFSFLTATFSAECPLAFIKMNSCFSFFKRITTVCDTTLIHKISFRYTIIFVKHCRKALFSRIHIKQKMLKIRIQRMPCVPS